MGMAFTQKYIYDQAIKESERTGKEILVIDPKGDYSAIGGATIGKYRHPIIVPHEFLKEHLFMNGKAGKGKGLKL